MIWGRNNSPRALEARRGQSFQQQGVALLLHCELCLDIQDASSRCRSQWTVSKHVCLQSHTRPVVSLGVASADVVSLLHQQSFWPHWLTVWVDISCQLEWSVIGHCWLRPGGDVRCHWPKGEYRSTRKWVSCLLVYIGCKLET